MEMILIKIDLTLERHLFILDLFQPNLVKFLLFFNFKFSLG